MRERLLLLVTAVARLLLDLAHCWIAALRSRRALAAENLFLRKQLALYVEHGARPRRADRATQVTMTLLARLFCWREALVIVKPETLIRWHRMGFRALWRWRSAKLGRNPIPARLRQLIGRIASENPTWGEERIAAELLLKLGIAVSPRTVRKYMPRNGDRATRRPGNQRWSTFVRNHAKAIVACDLFVSVTARFRVVCVLVVMDLGSRRILHFNVTPKPNAEWMIRQLRQAIPCDHPYRYLIHDRDEIFSRDLDDAVSNLRLRVLKTPPRTPKANSFCERLIGSIRRDCLDLLIPLGENHLRRLLCQWVHHYNHGRPHSSLGPGIPDPPQGLPVELRAHRHELPNGCNVVATPVLAGLHHEYSLEELAA